MFQKVLYLGMCIKISGSPLSLVFTFEMRSRNVTSAYCLCGGEAGVDLVPGEGPLSLLTLSLSSHGSQSWRSN